ncbi:2Fe-2S iron-sulfur cluster-binding protein [Rhodococcus sp. HM1]|uniref:2Fe-2S iron-sulfur cluster-binding protein n=1 Tax=Rhodococcus sp. HM1 TaxID=2937759 RepID=UPI00200B1344|nr:2Fe-2S iron-sulfur cluster-binding protein [Rhodococcus sp. HM1]MCK8672434.1 2Fe-2S iron-sulfur cluster-binding protein [Rhodococcus sp. HM1]
MNDASLWWYVTRASALVAWVTMTISALWGVLLSTRILRAVDNPVWLHEMHRWLGGTALTMTALHLLSLMLDTWTRFSVTDLLVPLAADYRPGPVALGIVAFYLLLAVYGSSLLHTRLPRRWWKALHYGSYGAVVLVSFHAGWSGTDVGTWGYRLVAFILLVSATVAALVRTLSGPGRPVTDASTPQPRAMPRPMTITAVRPLAADIVGLDLAPADGTILPVWQPGAHLTVHLPNGLQRRYSLCGDPAERNCYRIAVRRMPHSRGGSAWVHDHAVPGTVVGVSGPDNHFGLEPAGDYLFLAGGIGITPIKTMIESLPAHRSWRLIYVGRSRTTMAFCDELERRWPEQVSILARNETGTRPDLTRILAGTTATVYCCGPASMTNEVTTLVPATRLHVERFTAASTTPTASRRPFEVVCARSGRHVQVTEHQTLLDALEDAQIPVVASCREGVCGACAVHIINGHVEHLDALPLTPERNAQNIMYPCVSRSRSPLLTLDL